MEDRNGFLRLTTIKRQEGFLTAVIEENCQRLMIYEKLSFDDFNYREDLSSNNEDSFVKM